MVPPIISSISIVLVVVLGIKVVIPCNLDIGLKSSNLPEDAEFHFTGLSYKYGHNAEEFDVVTEDGYILKLFHIPGDKAHSVLLIHGNTLTADSWIVRGKTSLAINLADRGYDVWAINLRGTRYSRRHVNLDPDTQAKEFFNYSFYELGAYDLPATIDFILRKTEQSQILAIGHSVGTTTLYTLGAAKPEYNDKIKLAISLAPVSFVQHFGGICVLIPTIMPIVFRTLDLLNIYEIASYDLSPALQMFCTGPGGYDICIRHGILETFGQDEAGFEPAFVRPFFGHYPGGSSTKTFKHLLQVVQSNRFAKYDYGKSRNLEVYNSTEPPLLDLSKVTMKSALFVGKGDYLASVPDAERLRSQLPNVVHYQVMPYDKFNHADFVWGRYMPYNLYPHLLKVIEMYI